MNSIEQTAAEVSANIYEVVKYSRIVPVNLITTFVRRAIEKETAALRLQTVASLAVRELELQEQARAIRRLQKQFRKHRIKKCKRK